MLLCVFIDNESDVPVVVANTDVPGSDAALAVDIRDYLLDNESIVHWNGNKFDLPWIVKRLGFASEPPFLHTGSFDLMEWCKAKYPYLGGRLDTYLQATGSPYQKTELDMSINYRCAESLDDVEAWAYLTKHCVNDVLGMRHVYRELYEPTQRTG